MFRGIREFTCGKVIPMTTLRGDYLSPKNMSQVLGSGDSRRVGTSRLGHLVNKSFKQGGVAVAKQTTNSRRPVSHTLHYKTIKILASKLIYISLIVVHIIGLCLSFFSSAILLDLLNPLLLRSSALGIEWA